MEAGALEAQDSAIAIGSRLASAAGYPCRIGEKVAADTGALPRWPSFRARASSGLALATCLWLLWVANFNDLQFGGTDALRPYSLVQRIFGEASGSAGTPIGYQYGLAYLWVPFYGIGRLLSVGGSKAQKVNR